MFKGNNIMNQELTQGYLKSILHYDKDTGVFTWLVKTSTKTIIGSVAGTLDSKGQRQIRINKTRYLAHRLAWLYMYNELPVRINHINHIGDDNGLSNLQVLDQAQRNMKQYKTNTSGTTGIYWDELQQRWVVTFGIGGKKRKFVGTFRTLDDANVALQAALKEYGFHENHGK